MQVDELAKKVRREVEALSRELDQDPKYVALQEGKRFLRQLEQHLDGPAQPAVQPRPDEDTNGHLRKVKAGEKGEVMIRLLQEHGPLQPKQLRMLLRDQGIDPDAGTEVKRILWQLANEHKLQRYPDSNSYGPRQGGSPNGMAPSFEGLTR